jgi:ribosomal protein S18 acetylase RimI-like enzyme
MGALSNFRRKVTGVAGAATPPAAQPQGPQAVPSHSPDADAAPASVGATAPAPPAPLPATVACRPARRDEISVALRLVLGAGGHLADDSQVLDFMQFALRRGINLADLWLAEDAAANTLLWAVLPVLSPGRTMLLLGPTSPNPRHLAQLGAVPDTLVERVCAHFAARDVQLAQVLLEPSDVASRRLYEGRGFGRVAQLLYLQASPRRKTAPPALPPALRFVTYGPETHERFLAAVAATYDQSLDCPALNGLRGMEDVLAGHKASGQFDPALWMLLCEGETAVGVLLLSRVQPGDAVELVYLGLTPAARGRGLGDLLVRQALATVAAQRLSRLSLAVDAANAPALKLYYRNGLQQVAAKLALMRLLDTPRPDSVAATDPAPA